MLEKVYYSQSNGKQSIKRKILVGTNKKAPIKLMIEAYKVRQRPTFPPSMAVSSALVSLTSLFGMGRGVLHRHSHLKILNILKRTNDKR